VFVKLLHAYRTEHRLIEWGPWLTRVAVNACRDRRRSRWWRLVRESSVPLLEGTLTSVEPSPEARAVSREHHHRVWRAFRRLSARQQEVFVLRHLEGWPTEAVAEALALSPGSVKRHLFRAVHHLRTALEGL
jgi:RNA polymerase sigma-70 factor (ECF subfamily)